MGTEQSKSNFPARKEWTEVSVDCKNFEGRFSLEDKDKIGMSVLWTHPSGRELVNLHVDVDNDGEVKLSIDSNYSESGEIGTTHKLFRDYVLSEYLGRETELIPNPLEPLLEEFVSANVEGQSIKPIEVELLRSIQMDEGCTVIFQMDLEFYQLVLDLYRKQYIARKAG